MGKEATPPASGPANWMKKRMANGNGLGTKLFMGILAPLIVLAIVGGATASVMTKLDVNTIQVEQEHFRADVEEDFAEHELALEKVQTTLDTLQIPPPEFRAEVDQLGRSLREHIRTTRHDTIRDD